MDVDLHVVLINDFGVRASGIYTRLGPNLAAFEYNVSRLGKAWFEQEPTAVEVLDLIIHEFGHQYSGDHLSSAYHDALTRLGGQFTRLALDEPEWFSAV
jgi:hypothetical protein